VSVLGELAHAPPFWESWGLQALPPPTPLPYPLRVGQAVSRITPMERPVLRSLKAIRERAFQFWTAVAHPYGRGPPSVRSTDGTTRFFASDQFRGGETLAPT
jgi:hypothetical protein